MAYLILDKPNLVIPQTGPLEIDWNHEFLQNASDVFAPCIQKLDRKGSHNYRAGKFGNASYGGGSSDYAALRGRAANFHDHDGNFTVTFVGAVHDTSASYFTGWRWNSLSYRGFFHIKGNVRTDGLAVDGGFQIQFAPATGSTFYQGVRAGMAYTADPSSANYPFIIQGKQTAVSVACLAATSSDIQMCIDGVQRTSNILRDGTLPSATTDYFSENSGTIGFHCRPQFTPTTESFETETGYTSLSLLILHTVKIDLKLQEAITANPWAIFRKRKNITIIDSAATADVLTSNDLTAGTPTLDSPTLGHVQATDWFYPGAVSSVLIDAGDVGSWSPLTASNLQTDDNNYISLAVGSNNKSHMLKCTSFTDGTNNFSDIIGASDTIHGLELKVIGVTSNSTDFTDTAAPAVLLAGTPSGTAKPLKTWSNTESEQFYGASNDLWGATISWSDINNSNFGMGLRVVRNGSPSRTMNFERVHFRIHYIAVPGDNLTSNDVASGTPTLDNSIIAQIHALLNTDVATGNPSLDNSIITQTHILTNVDVTSGTPTLDNSTLGQSFILVSNDVATTAPSLDNSIIAQVHVFTNGDVATGNPSLDNSIITQVHVLINGDVATGNPSLDNSILTQLQNLIGTDLSAGTPTLDNSVLGQSFVLIANDVATTAPSLDNSTITQIHILTNVDVATGSPSLDNSVITQVHILVNTDVAAGTPILDNPILAIGTNHLTSNDVATTAPSLDNSILTQVHILTNVDLFTGNPSLVNAILGQIHILTNVDVTTGSPSLDNPILSEAAYSLVSNDVATGNPSLDNSTINQVHIFLNNDIFTGNPSLDNSTLSQVIALTADDLFAGNPFLDSPILIEGAPIANQNTLFFFHM